MPAFRLCGGTCVTSRSPKRIVPEVGSVKPAIIRSSVVFPHPDGPSRKKSWPGSMSISTRSTATVGPKVLRS